MKPVVNIILERGINMDAGDVIKKLRIEHNLTQEQLGEKLGVQKSAIAKYENGRVENLKRSTIQKMAELFDVSPLLFLGFDDEQLKSKYKIVFDDYFPLHYCTNLSAGSPTELLEAEPDAVVYVPIKFQNRKKRLHAFQVNGTSMNNVIQDGSIVVAEEVPDTVLKEGTIVVAWLDGEATVKRLYPGDSQVMLMPDSSDKGHHPITVNLEDNQLYIIGRVIWHMNPDDIAEYY